jgi:uncharacterized iron-regulated protein
MAPMERCLAFPRSLVLFALTAVVAIALGPARADSEWISSHHRSHPLVGTIWNTDFESVTPAQFQEALSKADFVMLGEIHNNPDHHRLQARIIKSLVASGRHPAIVFEMIPTSLQAKLDRYLADGHGNAAKLGKLLRWRERGWPDWAIYQPIAGVALAKGLPLIAGGLDREVIKAVANSQPPSAYTKTIEEFGLDAPVRPEITVALSREINEGHCNLLPDAAVAPMIKIQRARDAYLAKAMISAKDEGAVLIAGSGHVRKDWAVPSMIRRKLPDAALVSVAFFEVGPERTLPSAYDQAVPGLAKPFDFIYLTPRADLTDHCAEMAKFLKKKKKSEGSGGR